MGSMKTTTDVMLASLPDYVECGTCGGLHYFTISRQYNGLWTAAYVAFGELTDNEAILMLQDAETLEEVATRMRGKIDRHNRRVS